MNILVLSQYFWPECFRINDVVHGLVDRGHEVTILTGQPNYPGGKLFGAGINPSSPSADYHSLSVRLSAGETIDLIVGDGGNGHGNDSTAVRGQVTRVAKPAGWNLEADFSLTGGNTDTT